MGLLGSKSFRELPDDEQQIILRERSAQRDLSPPPAGKGYRSIAAGQAADSDQSKGSGKGEGSARDAAGPSISEVMG